MGKSKLDKLRNNAVFKSNSTVPTIKKYDTIIDYDKYTELKKEDKESLIEREMILKHTSLEIKKNLAEQSKAFYEANQIFVKNKDKDGKTFKEWYTELGFEKTYVYRCLQAYQVVLQFKKEKIYELPVRARVALYKNKDILNEEDIDLVINDENPINKIKEIQLKKEKELELQSLEKNINLAEYKIKLKNCNIDIADKKSEYEKVKVMYLKLKKELNDLKKIKKEITFKISTLKENL